LIQEMKLELSYSDITYDDLKDKKFIDLLVKNNVITENEKSEIVEFKKAYEVKKWIKTVCQIKFLKKEVTWKNMSKDQKGEITNFNDAVVVKK